MDLIFIRILNQSINAVYLMLAVLVVRMLIKKAPKWISCALWGLVALKLVLPFSLESALSLVPSREPIPQNIEYAEKPYIETGIYAINSTVNPIIANSLSPNPVENSVNPMQVVMNVCAYVWVAGIVVMLAYFCVSWLVMRKRVAEFRQFRDNVYLSDHVDGPFIFGIIRPRIYIPTGLAGPFISGVVSPEIYIPAELTGEKLECVIEHEMAHIKRLDHLWKPLGYLILTVYWFNPLCWISYILLCRDIELACDEKVTKDKDKEWKAQYCQTLLDCAAGSRKQRRIITACPIAFGEVGIKNRVKSVLNYKKPAFWIIVAALVVCVVTAVCFATSPVEEGDKTQGSLLAQDKSLEELEEKFPEYFDLGTFKGLEVYVWQMSENSYFFGVMQGTNRNKTTEELLALKPATAEEMKLILSTYDISDGEIFVIPYMNPVSSYMYWIEDERAYIQNVREMLGLESIDNVGIGDSMMSGWTESETVDVDATGLSSEEYAIRQAILAHNRSTEGATGVYSCASFIILDREFNRTFHGQDSDTITYYGWAFYGEYMSSGIRLSEVTGSHIPVVMSFDRNEDGEFSLVEYWEPRDGSKFASDIKEKVPAAIYEDMIDGQKFILIQKQDCFEQLIDALLIDPSVSMEGLLGIVMESPGESSDPQDYIDAHFSEYREMTYYGTHALRYCFQRFEKGGETGLEGQIMMRVCGDVAASMGEEPLVFNLPANGVLTGQMWYDAFKTNALQLKEKYSEAELAERYPASYLLLEMLGEL